MDKVLVSIRVSSVFPLIAAAVFAICAIESIHRGLFSFALLILTGMWMVISFGIFRVKQWARIACLWLLWLIFFAYAPGLYFLQFGGMAGFLLMLEMIIPIIIATIFLNHPIVKKRFEGGLNKGYE